MYTHLVVNPYDPNQDYTAFAMEVYDPKEKILVVREKKNGFHCHLQGVVTDAAKFEKAMRNLIDTHEEKIKNKDKRPVKRRKLAADEVGFQYMVKEKPTTAVIYKANITDEELDELYERSQEHVAELKAGLTDYIRDNATGDTPGQLLMSASVCAIRHYKETSTMCPPNLAALVRHAVMQHFYSPGMEAYLAEKLLARI